MAPDGKVENDGADYLAVDSGIKEVSGDPVRMHRREIEQIRLLKAQEEHVLARCVEGEQHLTMLEKELTEREGRPSATTNAVLGLVSLPSLSNN